jgi:hypothetical protein
MTNTLLELKTLLLRKFSPHPKAPQRHCKDIAFSCVWYNTCSPKGLKELPLHIFKPMARYDNRHCSNFSKKIFEYPLAICKRITTSGKSLTQEVLTYCGKYFNVFVNRGKPMTSFHCLEGTGWTLELLPQGIEQPLSTFWEGFPENKYKAAIFTKP